MFKPRWRRCEVCSVNLPLILDCGRYCVAVSASGDCNIQAGSSSSLVVGQLLDTLRGSSAAVYGVTVLQQELYIARDRSNVIEVFDVRSAALQSSPCRRRVVVSMTSLAQQVRPLDIASCAETRSIYVSDAANGSLHRVDPASGGVLASWRVDARAWGVSVTGRGTVLVCCRGAGLLCEYTPSGQLVRRVRLPDAVARPLHAVQMGDQFVVSLYDESSAAAAAGSRVCIVDDAGAVQRDHDQVCQPHHLAAVCDDGGGARAVVAVADCGNDRIKLLDVATLQVLAVVGSNCGIRRPHRLCVRQGRLYVGQWDGSVLVYQLLSTPGV